MLSAGYRQVLQMVAGIVMATFIFAAPATAQNNANNAVDQFLANPTQYMQNHPDGGARFISLIRDVAVSHPDALQTIMGLLANANTAQQMAIGSGLGQAAQIVVKTNQAYANQIQQAIAASSSEDAKLAFAGSTGNVSIASTGGGGGGGGGGGVGGQTGSSGIPFGGSNSGGTTLGGQHYQTSSQNYFTGGHAGGATNSSGGSSSSVSPH
jgi:hypothetical protein